MFKKLFFSISPIAVYTVFGNSMNPTYKNGEKVILIKKWLTTLKKNNVVVAKDPRNGRFILKRIKEITCHSRARFDSARRAGGNLYKWIQHHPSTSLRVKVRDDTSYFLIGDNEKESTDSREFGLVKKSDIIGKVAMKLSS